MEAKLRYDLKLAEEEVSLITNALNKVYNELNGKNIIIAALQRDLDSRSDFNLEGEEHQMSHMNELENAITGKDSFISELQEKIRESKDQFDLLTADNEKLKQKYLTSRREFQRLKNSSRFRRLVTITYT